MSGVLHCDAEGCGHEEQVGEITGDMVGSPCPKCGANLLTQEDYDFYAARTKPMYDLLMRMGLVKPAVLGEEPGEGEAFMSVRNHNGETFINIKEGK